MCNRCSKPKNAKKNNLYVENNINNNAMRVPIENVNSFNKSNKLNTEINSISSRDVSPNNIKESKKKVLTEREGDWTCVRCKNLNFSFRKFCNRCELPKNENNQISVNNNIPINLFSSTSPNIINNNRTNNTKIPNIMNVPNNNDFQIPSNNNMYNSQFINNNINNHYYFNNVHPMEDFIGNHKN